MPTMEKVARIIEPIAWEQYNHAVRPYAEGRGSVGLENAWYTTTYGRVGCRSVSDLNKWFFEEPFSNLHPAYVVLVRESLRKANAILDLIKPTDR